ncbi:MAG: efflux RND transporter permease subunit, partial [Proteobacteria bacterium]|nr:efflux RND transporter permease subunit [Pseudomonadota bacterium]
MKLSEICIQRPVLAWVMTIILILVGIVGGTRLSLQQYPKFDRPFLTIETQLPGAGPEIVEAQVTRIIEEAVSGIEGIEEIISTSSVEDSKVTLVIRLERRVDDIANDIRDRLNKVKDKFDDAVTEPTLTRSKAEEKPIITLALVSDKMDASALADYAIKELQKELEALPGVARVDVLGAGEYIMHIYLNPVKLAAYNLTVSDVLHALKRQSIEKPAGKLISKDREYLVTTVATLETVEEFNSAVIVAKEGHLVRLHDIGYAEIDADDRRTKTRYNGKMGVSIGIIKQSTANPIDVAREVKKLIPVIEERLPAEAKIHLGSDRTLFIERSIKEVYKTILEATFLVILVVFLFLRSARASLIPLVTIPVSLIGALFLMYVLNFSINTFTLMAMVLAIGLVVDDAIVVLENIYRYIEAGYKPFEAAVKGIREISFAVIAMTLTLAAVYTPVSLARGLTGKLLTEFAITLAGAVIISGFAALTLSPMMCARMLKAEGDNYKNSVLSKWPLLESIYAFWRSEKWLHEIEKFYEHWLYLSLRKKHYIVLSAIGFAAFGYFIYNTLPRELTPREDQGQISMEGQSPQTATLDYTDRYVAQIDQMLSTIPEIERRVTQINNPTFDVFVQLAHNSSRPTDEIVTEIRTYLDNVTGIESRAQSAGGGIAGEKNKEVEFVVMGNKTYREIRELAERMTISLYQSGIMDSIRSEMRGDSQDYTITILRDKVSALNIEPATIGESVDALIRGKKANTFKKDNKLYQVKVEVEDRARQTPHDITNLFVKAGDKEGTLVPLSELVTVQSRSGPVEIHHHNRQRSITLSGHLKAGYSLGDGVEKVKELAKDILPKDARIEFTGETKSFLTESQTMNLVFGLALAFIYLVMAAQFESWRDPLIIMLSVPLSLAGAVITLSLIDYGSLNLYSNIGLVTLIGLITKHGIMLVDFANKLKQEGYSSLEAITRACKLRLRPILMTTFAMVLGALPLAFATGAGLESRRQIGWVVVG